MRTDEENRQYAKGYAAGQRRAAREYNKALAEWRREQFRQQVFLAVLPELVRAPWQTGGKRWTQISEFVDGAWDFARRAQDGAWFSGEQF